MKSRVIIAAFAASLVVASCGGGESSTGSSSATNAPSTDLPTTAAPETSTEAPSTTAAPDPASRHVAIIVLENTSYEETFGANSAAPYLSQELVSQGLLLENYYGIGHVSLPNYIAMISGQAATPQTQADCGTFDDFVSTGVDENGQVLGEGCVYPADVMNIGNQLEEADLTWKNYAEDMGASTTEPATCRHPVVGESDPTLVARVGDGYATRHVPFLYFHSVIDSPSCDQNVVDLGTIEADLASADTTPNLVFITPNLCSDGHDHSCVDGSVGGLAAANAFLQNWIPKLLASPAFASNGLVIVTFDEAEVAPNLDATSCCGDLPAPNLTGPAGLGGPGGGRVGAVLLGSPVQAGTSSTTDYNHYSLLCSLENLWGLGKLGYAAHPATPCFGTDVFNADASWASAN